jgi:NADPH:quinone reductase-like Zn-dependent oxidoreductase
LAHFFPLIFIVDYPPAFRNNITMKGVVFSSIGAEPQVVDNLPIPNPSDGQVLVKSLWTAINPVDAYSATTGLLVVKWPLTLGVDASGVITKTGPKVPAYLSVGTHVFGCTRLGSPSYGTAAEYFLIDAKVAFAVTAKMKERGIGGAEASTLGVSVLTAALGIFDGLKIPISTVEQLEPKDEWVLILGGASSVGKSAISLARAAGFKVIASCSPGSSATVEKLGSEWFSYKDPLEDQVAAVSSKTGGKLFKIFDAVASDDPLLAKEIFRQASGQEKLFATTNDWSGITHFEGGKTTCIEFGPVGRPDATDLNKMIEEYIPVLTKLIEDGKVLPSEYEAIGEGGFESAAEAYKYQQSGKGGNKKVVVKIQDA